MKPYMWKEGEFDKLVKKGIGAEFFSGDEFTYSTQAAMTGLRNIADEAFRSEVSIAENAPVFPGKVKVLNSLRMINASAHLLLISLVRQVDE